MKCAYVSLVVMLWCLTVSQIRAYETLSSISPAITLRPIASIKLEDVYEYPYVSVLLLPYVDGMNMTWGHQWPELRLHSMRAQMFEKMAAVR